MEENRIALIGIIIENNEISENVNAVLHEYGGFIVGRMGLPYREKSLNVISVVVDAPNNIINSMTGKLGMLDGVSAKALYSNK
ncbi:MAG: TM1266 family iron-only hydrogenase system putative regulator [Christensenellales bacterium]|jgi:putative iron-only hydrogenase system regulator